MTSMQRFRTAEYSKIRKSTGLLLKESVCAVLLSSCRLLLSAGATNSDAGQGSALGGAGDRRRCSTATKAGWTMAPGTEFPGHYHRGRQRDRTRAVILVHGVGVHPNWPDVIYPLRAGLLEARHHDAVDPDADTGQRGRDGAPIRRLFAEVPGRFEAALDWHGLPRRGYSQDHDLVAHSMGASMSVYYLSQATCRIAGRSNRWCLSAWDRESTRVTKISSAWRAGSRTGIRSVR